jgi:hypothetical protein
VNERKRSVLLVGKVIVILHFNKEAIARIVTAIYEEVGVSARSVARALPLSSIGKNV